MFPTLNKGESTIFGILPINHNNIGLWAFYLVYFNALFSACFKLFIACIIFSYLFLLLQKSILKIKYEPGAGGSRL
jgi:hypothetical protein